MRLNLIGATDIFSFNDILVDLSNKQFCSITGENKDTNDSNGSGKSSLIEIPRLVLFKKSSKKNIIRDGCKKGSAFIVLDDVMIERNFPGDKIKINGDDASQEELESFFGMSDQLFCNTHYYRQEIVNTFVSSSPAKQMEMITQMLPELAKFDIVRASVSKDKLSEDARCNELKARLEEIEVISQDEIKAMKKDIETESIKLSETKKLLDSYKNKMDELSKIKNEIYEYDRIKNSLVAKKEKFQIKKEKYKTEKELLDGIKKELDAMKWSEKSKDYKEYQDRMVKTNNRIIVSKTELSQYEKAMKLQGLCPTCLQPINRKIVDKLYGNRINELNTLIKNDEDSASMLKNKINDFEQTENKHRHCINQLEVKECSVSNLENDLLDMKKEFEELKNSLPKKSEKTIEEITSEIDSVNNDHKDCTDIIYSLTDSLATKKNRLELADSIINRRKELEKELFVHNDKFIISDYWNKQLPIIKVRVIDDNIATMELIMNDYLSDLYPTFNVKIDTVSELKTGEVRDKLSFKIMTDMMSTRDWDDLSGGEKARVALGCQMASMFMTKKFSINFEFYDEIFRPMDDSGIEATINLLRKRSENNQIFAISHSKDACSYFDDNIHVVKEKGISCVI